MKFTVTYSCGHDGVVELYGKHTDREKKLTWYKESAVCPACYKAKQAEKVAAATSKYSFPELTGSEKQIAYAESLRGQFALSNSADIDEIIKIIAYTKTDAAIAKVKAQGMSMEDALEDLFKKIPHTRKAYVVLNESNAGKVIETLRSF